MTEDTDTPVAAVPLQGPEASVIEFLEGLLERAKEGEVIGVAVVFTLRGSSSGYARRGWTDYPITIAQFELAKRRLMDGWLSNEDEEES